MRPFMYKKSLKLDKQHNLEKIQFKNKIYRIFCRSTFVDVKNIKQVECCPVCGDPIKRKINNFLD